MSRQLGGTQSALSRSIPASLLSPTPAEVQLLSRTLSSCSLLPAFILTIPGPCITYRCTSKAPGLTLGAPRFTPN